MRYRKHDADGDYTIGINNFYIDEPEAVAQLVMTRLKLWRGEWFLDENEGMPWVGGVLGKTQLKDADITIRQHILETDGVLSIDDFEIAIDPQDRKLTVTATIETIYGQAQLVEVL